MPRGGPRTGAPLPARAPTGQTYGRAQQQMQAQRTVPMAPPPQVAGVMPGGGMPAPPGAPPPGPSAPPGAGQPAPVGPPPGSFGMLNRPTERPMEPVTSGAPVGAGPGPEALPQAPSSAGQGNLSDMLRQIASSSGSQALAELAMRAGATGQ